MSIKPCTIGSTSAGAADDSLLVIAGPCVLEDDATNRSIATFLHELCGELDLPLIFKASFDKANRSSIASPRGPGAAAGLEQLAALGREIGRPTTTDVHEPAQAGLAAEAVDLLQIPAFLCRQTDLLVACAKTGRAVNVKKGQFLSPGEMVHVIEKLEEAGATNIMVTERGTFFGYQRLVNDFIGLGDLAALGRPVCFDITHSTQLPGAGAGITAGRPERAGLLGRAAVAAGVHAVFLETHPDPSRARSDGATVQSFAAAERMLRELSAIRVALGNVRIEG
ncbi:MAG: 3-deoxy-8-phosphooctulonate synthase [Phycisphaerales bacterium]